MRLYSVVVCVIVDNVFSLKNWIKNKFQIDESTVNKQLEIPDDFDYIN